jgi:hypothetical protein
MSYGMSEFKYEDMRGYHVRDPDMAWFNITALKGRWLEDFEWI